MKLISAIVDREIRDREKSRGGSELNEEESLLQGRLEKTKWVQQLPLKNSER